MTALRSGDGALYRDNPQRSSKRCGRRISADFDRRLHKIAGFLSTRYFVHVAQQFAPQPSDGWTWKGGGYPMAARRVSGAEATITDTAFSVVRGSVLTTRRLPLGWLLDAS